jgi:hypothetical protein
LLRSGDVMAGASERRSTERRQSERRGGGAPDFRGLAPFDDLAGHGDDILGYRVVAPDGEVGRAADFCFEHESWVVTGVLVAPRRFLPTRRRVFVPLNAIERIDQRARTIYARLGRDELSRGSRRQARGWGNWWRRRRESASSR